MNGSGEEQKQQDWPDGEAPLRTQQVADERESLIVDVGGFEGPLDLLLELARHHKIDLKQISILALAEQYLGIAPEDLEPIPPDPVPPAPGNPPELENCVNSMGWVADLSYDDQNMTAPPVMFPGQPFTKSWRIRNTGTCTWDSTRRKSPR